MYEPVIWISIDYNDYILNPPNISVISIPAGECFNAHLKCVAAWEGMGDKSVCVFAELFAIDIRCTPHLF